MPTRRDDWIDDDEYPDDRDVEELGDDSPFDDDPLTIGYAGRRAARRSFWTPARLVLLVIVLILVAALVLPLLLPVMR